MINMSINRTQHEVYYGKTDVTNNQELLNIIIKAVEMSNKKKLKTTNVRSTEIQIMY